MSRRILHITDLHINDPRHGEEHLRADSASEYLKSLVNAVRNEAGGQIDCIVATGDFVDRAKMANFGHAKHVLETLAKMLSLSLKSVSICIGNHDLDRPIDESGNARKARDAYTQFAVAVANGNPIKASDRAILCCPAADIYCLMLDATLGCRGADNPGTLERTEVDEIMGWVLNDIPPDSLLVVGSHYPVFETPDMLLSVADDEPRFQERHLWHSAKLLRHRIAEWRQNVGETVWLCGDIHASDQFMSRDILTLATGRLGTRIGGSAVRKQARVIQSGGIGQVPRLWTLNYEPAGHKEEAHYGRWTAVETKIRIILPPQPGCALTPTEVLAPPAAVVADASSGATTPVITNAASLATPPSAVPSSVKAAAAPSTSAPPVPTIDVPPLVAETLDPNLERLIMGVIARERLYALGRFNTSTSAIALSWVSIGPLLESAGILPGTVDAMAEWLRRQIKPGSTDPLENVLLIGIDCWGSVLASQLAVLTGASNYCVASRGGGRHHTASEIVNAAAIEAAKKAAAIVLVTDVISTGQSISSVSKAITSGLASAAAKKRWFALSILCDNRRVLTDCQFLHAHGTACGILRMPVLGISDLPGEDLLPAILSFL